MKPVKVTEERRREIETALANTLHQYPEIVWPAVSKVSQSILNVIEQQLSDNPRTLYQALSHAMNLFYSDFAFARLGDPADMPMLKTSKGTIPDVAAFVETIKNILQDNDPSKLQVIMHIHAEFSANVLKKLNASQVPFTTHTQPSFRQLACQKVAGNQAARDSLRKHFYLCKKRPRLDLYAPHPRTEFADNPGLNVSDKIEVKKTGHTFVRAVDRARADSEHPYVTYIKQMNIPFVAGPSGHTGILLRGALTMTDLTIEECQQYLLATVAMIVGGGMHSFHEVMTVGQAIGLPYIDGCYQETFSQSFKQHDCYQAFTKLCPEVLSLEGDEFDKTLTLDKIFHRANLTGDSAITSELIHLGIALDARDASNQTAVDYAMLLGHEDIAVQLVRANADITSLGDDCVNLALQKGFEELAQELIECGARVDIVDEYQKRPIDYAHELENYNLVEKLLERGQTLPRQHKLNSHLALLSRLELLSAELINRCEDLSDLENTQPPMLSTAAMLADVKTMQLLLQKGVDINVSDTNQHNALHWAVLKGQSIAVRMLIDNQINVNAKDQQNNTALHFAVENGFIKITQQLLSADADADSANAQGVSARDLAKQSQLPAMRKLFELGDIGIVQTIRNASASYDDDIKPFISEWKNTSNPLLFLAPEFSLAEQKPKQANFSANFFARPV